MDPRVARTRQRLQQALLDLAGERPLDEITIGDITERAEVNRSSFYQHYGDKDSLLADALEAVLDAAAAPLRATAAQGEEVGMPPELEEYLRHIADNIALYRRVLGPHGSAVVAARLRRRVELVVRETIGADATGALEDVPLDVVGAGIAGTALGVISAWVEHDPLPPVDVAARWLDTVLRAPARMLR
ncbi:TetR/AcrR family transcriptional regulator [Microbacterium hominis]|uniref:TetR/AcrR family transcriptional regulator n=1 Tax=Microbacterium hominis TaxID=162426 RepID=A0A7D4UCA8_9MICO|nr:TetR/AcrR family transcriptional regulator [Microbacterium hominis]QKJ20463.1 TetR/AcrR family transcriptional regulator [Microbacterium hominis]